MDGFLIDKCLLQLDFVRAQFADLARNDALYLLAVALFLPPDIEHNLAVQAHVTSIGLQLPDELLELPFHCVFCRSGAAILTVIVAVIPIAAFRPASGERLSAISALHEAAQGKVGMTAGARSNGYSSAVEDRLHLLEDGLRNQRLKFASNVDVPLGNHNSTGINRLP